MSKSLDVEEAFDPRWTAACISEPDWHFHRQLLHRYGVVLNVGQFSQILWDIRHGRARLIRAKGEKRGIYAVSIGDADTLIYILAIDGFPRTAWPPEDAERLIRKGSPARNTALP